MYGYYGYDTLFLAVIVVELDTGHMGPDKCYISKNTYKKYSQEYASSGVTAANMAERMFYRSTEARSGKYDDTRQPYRQLQPPDGLVSLSQSTYGSNRRSGLSP